MQRHTNRIARTLTTARYTLAGLILTIAFILTLLPERIPLPSGASPAVQTLEGGWQTYANGDDIQALALDGDTLWAGSRAGGVVRWNLRDGSYTQYLYPQTDLACNDVRDIYVGGAGVVWFATCRGLSTLSPDGTWHTYTVDNTDGRLPSNNITAIAADPAGYLWIGADQGWNGTRFEGGGLARWEWATGEWQTFTPLTSPAVVDVAVDRNGKVWVATKPFTTWVPPTDGEPGHWGRRGGGLAVWNGTNWQSYTSESDVADSITALAVDEAGNTWVGTEGNGAFAFTELGRVHFRAGRGGLTDGYISAIGFGLPAGSVWLATRQFNGTGTGISVLDPGSNLSDTSDDHWVQYTTEDGLAAELVTAIAGDGNRLWLGTSDPSGSGQGISRFDATGFHPPLLTRPTNLAGNQITAVVEAPDGRLWVGTAYHGLSVLAQDRRSWTTYTKENTDPDGNPPWTGLRGNSVSDIAFDSTGRAWIGTRRTIYNVQLRSFEDGGLSLFDPVQNQWVTFTQRNTDDDSREPWRGLRSDEVSAVAVDWNDHIWVGSGSLQSFTGVGISVLNTSGTPGNLADDVWSHHDIFDKIPSNNITDIVIDRTRQIIWVASVPYWTNSVRTGGGVGRFDGTVWTRWNNSNGLVAAENEIRSLTLGLSGDVWAGGWTYQGSFHWPTGMGVDAVVNHFDGTIWQMKSMFEDDGYIAALVVTADRTVWAGTSKDGHGTAPATGGVKRLSGEAWTSFNTDNAGLAGNEIHAVVQDAAGDLWFGSRANGLSRLGRDLPIQPTPTPRPPSTLTPTATPAATFTPTVTPHAPGARVEQAYLPLMLLGYVRVQGPPSPTPSASPVPPITVTVQPGPTRTPTPTPVPGITPTLTSTPGPDTTPTNTPTAFSTPTATVPPPSPTPTATRPSPTVEPSSTPKPIPSGAWVPVLDVPPINLFDVFFVEAAGSASGPAVWAVGEQGVILHSADGGSTWDFQDSQTEDTLRSVYFLDQRTGWVVGDNGTIRHTSDGGQTWQSQNSSVRDEALVAVAMTSPTHGWVLGAQGTVLRWNGSQWTAQSSTNYSFTALVLTSDDDGWATTSEADTIGRIIRLSDGRWMPDSTFQGLQDIVVRAAGQGWAVGSRGTVVRQLEGRWELISRPPTGGQTLYAVHSPGPDQAWVMGTAGLIFFYNQDRWENKTDTRVTRETIYAMRMTADGRQGWAVGEAGLNSGTILRFMTSP